jgi:ABC-type phosphate transport system auxiliary subunit
LCGIEIREILLDGREIPDELYVRLFVNKLRVTYEYKTPQQKMDEVKSEAQEICDMNLRISELDKELLGELKDKQRQKKVEERARLMKRHATL